LHEYYCDYSEISPGVATQLRCGGIFSNHFITNFPQNVLVKKICKSVNIWRRYGQKFVAYFFGPSGRQANTQLLAYR